LETSSVGCAAAAFPSSRSAWPASCIFYWAANPGWISEQEFNRIIACAALGEVFWLFGFPVYACWQNDQRKILEQRALASAKREEAKAKSPSTLHVLTSVRPGVVA
jgi:hypothetical protein